MGNVSAKRQTEDNDEEDKEKFWRMFGIRMPKEADDNEDVYILPDRSINILIDNANKQMRIEEFPRLTVQVAAEAEVSNMEAPQATITEDSFNTALVAAKQFRNPGTVEELHAYIRNIQAPVFEGLKLVYPQDLHSSYGLCHTLNVEPKRERSCYQLEGYYRGQHFDELTNELYPNIMGCIDTHRNLYCKAAHFITPRLCTKLQASISKHQRDFQLTADYFGDYYTCSLMLANPNLKQEMGIFTVSYLQEALTHLAVGVELCIKKDEDVFGAFDKEIFVMARYDAGQKQWSAKMSPNQLELCYSQFYGEHLKASVQMLANILKRSALTQVSYCCAIPKGDFVIRGMVDSNGVVATICEKSLQPFPATLQLSGTLDHVNGRLGLGFGVIFK